MDGSSAWDTPLAALRSYWWLIALVTLVGVGAGIAYGLARDRTYTAEARMSVGRVDVATQAIPGFAIASRQLADTYSRTIVADEIVSRVAERTGLSEVEVVEGLSATPIPETATIRLESETDSAQTAVRAANAGAFALIDYVHDLNRHNPDTDELLRRYGRAAKVYGAAKARLERLGSSPERQSEVVEAKLQLQSVAGLYTASLAGQSSPNTLQLIAKAARVEDDRDSAVQQAALAGGVAGALIGALMAIFFHRRHPPINAPSAGS